MVCRGCSVLHLYILLLHGEQRFVGCFPRPLWQDFVHLAGGFFLADTLDNVYILAASGDCLPPLGELSTRRRYCQYKVGVDEV